jgi:acyl carrier protein phosphodiesterase
LRALSPPFQPGIVRHRAIDAFTDKHQIFRQSIARLDPKFRRFGGVIMDIFYDHLLTATWNEYVDVALDDFVGQFHADVETCRGDIPAGAYAILHHMRTGAWLTSYGDVSGVRITLDRIAKRLRRPVELGAAAGELQRHYPGLSGDFADFFPQIKQHFSGTAGS